jgi:hypothetical protein
MLGALHAAVVVMQIGHFSHTTKHYYGWLSISACLWVALLLAMAARKSGLRAGRAAAIAAGAAAAVQAWGVAGTLRTPMDPLMLRNARTELIAWIDSHLPAGEPVGSWNAGQLGYFLDRPVVNLDGLVNDAGFLEFLRRGEPVVHYLRHQGIRYVVDYNHPDLSMPFRADWDRDRLFRNEIPWSHVERVQERRTRDRTLYVLRLTNTP